MLKQYTLTIKEIETESVQSSHLHILRYDTDLQELQITFNNGSVYVYADVPIEEWQGLIAASSKGKYFHRYIRDTYNYSRLS